MTAPAENLRLHRGRGPQGLRRLRFSFFLFTCQTARERGAPTLRRTEEPTKLRHPRTTGWRFTVPVRSFRGASSRRNAVAGADGPYIGGGSIRCQRENRKFFDTHFRRRANSREATRNGRDLCANRHLVSPKQTSMPHRSHIRGTSYRTNFPRG